MSSTWKDVVKVQEYVERVGRLTARSAGEAELIEALPAHVSRVLDLGCGDGRLIGLVLDARPELHEEFNRRIERPGGDPEDQLAEVEPQLRWMRDAGLTQVDCNWRWRGFALLVGQAPQVTT